MRCIVYFSLLLLAFSSCLRRAPKTIYPACYGVEHNPVRDSLGLVLLDSSWVPDTLSLQSQDKRVENLS